MKKNLLFTAALILFLSHLNAQALFQEDFETGWETNGWLVSSHWQIGTAATLSSAGFSIPAHTQFAGINDDGAGPGTPSFGRIISPQIDLTGVESALLHFDTYFANGDYDADELARVFISTDSMLTWYLMLDLEGNPSWKHITLNLVDIFADKKIHLAFEYNDNNGWNFGFCVDNVLLEVQPDYFAQVTYTNKLDYTHYTPRQLNGNALQLVHQYENYGSQPLVDVSMHMTALMIGQGIQAEDTHLLSIPQEGVILDTFNFLPLEIGEYSFLFKASHPQLGQDFFQQTLMDAFSLSDSILAKDDGERDVSIGMSFGDPNWYGYYGSEFDLNVADTLTGISVWMDTNTAGSFNLTVNALEDGIGLPTEVIYHSPPIEINPGYNNWFYHPLPNPLPLAATTYVFAVGQDSIQGIMGHGFDQDRQNLGYWIMSPVAGGGYPWTKYDSPTDQFNWTLMIRPHFKVQPIVNALNEPAYSPLLKVSPNPAKDYLYFDWEKKPAQPVYASLTDAAGRVAISQKMTSNELNISHLPSGVYFLKIQDGQQVGMAKVVKQ